MARNSAMSDPTRTARPVVVLILGIVIFIGLSANAETVFYGLDKSQDPGSLRLVQFNSNPGDPSVQELLQIPGLLPDPVGAGIALSNEGRLFVAPYDALNTIFEIDAATGEVLDSVAVPFTGTAYINGMTVSDSGLIYISQEVSGGGNFWVVNFDAHQSTHLVEVDFDVDSIDFDSDGNLIGNDINETGRLFNIPLDGSAVQVIATIPVSDTPIMTFSEAESVMYFEDTSVTNNGRGLWRLPWLDGSPSGSLEFVKEIGDGHYVGFTAIPEPSTAIPLSLFLPVLSRKSRRTNPQST